MKSLSRSGKFIGLPFHLENKGSSVCASFWTCGDGVSNDAHPSPTI